MPAIESLIQNFRECYGAKPDALLSPAGLRAFRALVRRYYRYHGRILPWRGDPNPYQVLVSEIMLQQTQVDRVIVKYREFMDAFPTMGALAESSLKAVLAAWQGLGYNRRAAFLHRAARIILREHKGVVPDDPDLLAALPGIGRATAASITAFAFNRPVVFIETNIRSVFIHIFFTGKNAVSDADILPLVAATLDRKNPARWYSALMDFGSGLKRHLPNPGRASRHYQRQSRFEGSNRQRRGKVLALLLQGPARSLAAIAASIGLSVDDARVIIHALCDEGLIVKRGDVYAVE